MNGEGVVNVIAAQKRWIRPLLFFLVESVGPMIRLWYPTIFFPAIFSQFSTFFTAMWTAVLLECCFTSISLSEYLSLWGVTIWGLSDWLRVVCLPVFITFLRLSLYVSVCSVCLFVCLLQPFSATSRTTLVLSKDNNNNIKLLSFLSHKKLCNHRE